MRQRANRKAVAILAGVVALLCGAGDTRAQEEGMFVVVRPVPIPFLNTPSIDGVAAVSPDGLRLYFTSDRPWAGKTYREKLYDIYEASREAPGEPWAIRAVDELNTPGHVDAAGSVAEWFYFSSNRRGDDAAAWDSFVAEWNPGTRRFDRCRPLDEINAQGVSDLLPVISCDEKTIIFASMRQPTQGGSDFWIAVREDGEREDGEFETRFGAPKPLPGNLNSPAFEAYANLFCDGRTLFFSDICFWDCRRPNTPCLAGFCTIREDGRGLDDLWWGWWPDPDQDFQFRGSLSVFGEGLNTPFNDHGPTRTFDWPEEGSILFFLSDRPHPRARGWTDSYEATWLPGRDIAFEEEEPWSRGAINCGGLEVDAMAELGFRFEEDRFFGDEVRWRGNAAQGYVVTRTALGHAPIDVPRDRPVDSWVVGVDNTRPIDLGRIPGAGEAAAELFATSTVSRPETAWLDSWPPPLRTERLRYQVRVVPGRYAVTLYFAEFSPAAVGGFGEGKRLIDVALNEVTVLENWSAGAAAGGDDGSPQVSCGAVLDTAVARRFSLSVGDEDPNDGEEAGQLELIVEPSGEGEDVLPAALSAFSFERTGDVDGAPPAGEIERVMLAPGFIGVLEEDALERARDRWSGGRGALFVNCGGPLLACSATENPAKAATGDDDAGTPVVWLPDLALGPVENEFFRVKPAVENAGLGVAGTDMGFWDARGTEPGRDQNDRIFHCQREGQVEYEVPVPEGTYEVTLYFANLRYRTSGTGLRNFHVVVENETQDGFEPCPHRGRERPILCWEWTETELQELENPVFGATDLFDPVGEADRLYGEACAFQECPDPRVGPWVGDDSDNDGIPAYLEWGNAAAVALRVEKEVRDGALNIALLKHVPPNPDEWFNNPQIAGISVERIDGLFRRGDANADGEVNITDGVFIFVFLFTGGPTPPCLDAADTSDRGVVNISSGIYILNFLFRGGPPPPAPFPDCGEDPTKDDLDCRSFPPCAGVPE